MARALSTISARTALIRLSWLMIFEEEFHCQITDDDAAKILTVGDAVKFLEENATTWRHVAISVSGTCFEAADLNALY
jgi:hypothetical protein